MNLPVEIVLEIFHGVLFKKRISKNRYRKDFIKNVIENFDDLLNFIFINKQTLTIFKTFKKSFLKQCMGEYYHGEKYFTLRVLYTLCDKYPNFLYKPFPKKSIILKLYRSYNMGISDKHMFKFIAGNISNIGDDIIPKSAKKILIERLKFRQYYEKTIQSFDISFIEIFDTVMKQYNIQYWTTLNVNVNLYLDGIYSLLDRIHYSEYIISEHHVEFLTRAINILYNQYNDIFVKINVAIFQKIETSMKDDNYKTKLLDLLTDLILKGVPQDALIHKHLVDKDLRVQMFSIYISYYYYSKFSWRELYRKLDSIFDKISSNTHIKLITYEMHIILTIIKSDRSMNSDVLFDRYVDINKHIFKAIRKKSYLMCDFLWKIAGIEHLFNEYDYNNNKYIIISDNKRHEIIQELFNANAVWDRINSLGCQANKIKLKIALFDDYYYSIIPTASIEVIIFWSIFTDFSNVMSVKKIKTATEIAMRFNRFNVVRFLNTLKLQFANLF